MALELFTDAGWQAVAERYRLSPRQLEVAKLVVHGRRNAQIAAELDIKPGTVASYIFNIMLKMHVDSQRRAAVLICVVLHETATAVPPGSTIAPGPEL